MLEKHQYEIFKTMQEHDYKILNPIGEGGFATCFTCFSEKYNQTYCVKLMELSSERKTLPETFNAEINSLIKVIHPNVVGIYDYFNSKNILYIILEYCTGGSLDQIIKMKGKIDPPELYTMCKQIINALMVVHSLGIAHRDIKPQNILLDNHHRPKLADFGLAQQITKSELSERFSGSLPFKSPEILNMRPYDPFLGDVWALGVTFYYMAFGALPWKANTMTDWKLLVESGITSFPSTQCGVNFNRALKRMIEPKVNQRASLDEISKMPVFAEAGTPIMRNSSKQFLNTSPSFNLNSNLIPRKPTGNALNNNPAAPTNKKSNQGIETAGLIVSGPNQTVSRSQNIKKVSFTPGESLNQQQKVRVNGNVPAVGIASSPSMKGVFTWKRRCSKVTKMIHYTFNDSKEQSNTNSNVPNSSNENNNVSVKLNCNSLLKPIDEGTSDTSSDPSKINDNLKY